MDHQKWAKIILKFLVNRIKNFTDGDKYITYGNLAKKINYPEPHRGSYFGKRIGKTLGVMGYLFEGMIIDGEPVPLIQAMVVNQSKNLPGDGLKEFNDTYPHLSDKKKKDFLYSELERISQFGERWFEVLKKLDITPEESEDPTKGDKQKYNPFGNEGSPEHRALRDYISKNPSVINLDSEDIGITEYPLKSGDHIDVVFDTEESIIGVEVKSHRSGNDDILRGLFQCIKYSAVLEAEEIVEDRDKNWKCVLVIEDELNRTQKIIKNKLGIEVFENISP